MSTAVREVGSVNGIPVPAAAAPLPRARLGAQGPGTASTPRRRVEAVDAARGVALLGMFAVHVLDPADAVGNPTLVTTVAAGRAAALFVVLAGVAVSFMTGRTRVPWSALGPHAAGLATRAVVIATLGVLLLGGADPEQAVVILPYYGLLFLLAILLISLPTWAVGGVAVAAATGGTALTHVLLPHLPPWTGHNIGTADVLHDPIGTGAGLAVTGDFPALTWMAYLATGVLIGRLDLTRVRTAASLLVTGALLAVGCAVASEQLMTHGGRLAIGMAQDRSVLTAQETSELLSLGGDGTVPAVTWWWQATDAPHTGTALDLGATTGSALAVLGVFSMLAVARRRGGLRPLGVVLGPLAAAGSMTLTLYVTHILFINSSFDPDDRPTSVVLQAIAALLLATGWRALAGRGPFEAGTRALSRRAGRAVSGTTGAGGSSW